MRFSGGHRRVTGQERIDRHGADRLRLIERLESRLLLSSGPSAPGVPHIKDIATDGANLIKWKRSIDNGGGKITYTLQYQQEGSSGWTDAGSTTTTSRSLTRTAVGDANPIQPDTVYLVQIVATDSLGRTSTSLPAKFTTEKSLTPATIISAYDLNRLYNKGYTGAGVTIGLVEQGTDPTLVSDVNTFDSEYNLPTANLTIYNQDGATSPLPTATTSEDEISLDAEWVHAIAPGANIVVIEGKTGEGSTATATQINSVAKCAEECVQLGASVVSMSLGFFESSFGTSGVGSEKSYDADFSAPGVTYVAAAGDYYGSIRWPSASPNTLAVGGTQLSVGPSGGDQNQIPWVDIGALDSSKGSGTGFGLSSGEPGRETPDVAYDADGYSFVSDGKSHGEGFGTSFGTPQWAALIAIADEGRLKHHLSPLASDLGAGNPDGLLAALDSAPASDFELNSAGNGTASAGYNLETGLGTPTAELILYLMKWKPTS
jgi:subtilase family serine protease